MTRSFNIPGSRPHYPPDKEYLTSHIRLELKLDFTQRKLDGHASIVLTPVRQGLRVVHFDACEMQVGTIKLDGAETRSDYDGRRITLELERPLDLSRHVVSIDYSTVPRQGGYFVGPDEAYPHKPVQFWTHSETECARYWYPCHDYPDDKSASEISVAVPEGFTAISNGKLVELKKGDGEWVFYWSESVPHSTYLNSVVVGVFEEMKDDYNGIPVTYYFKESDAENAPRAFGETPEMMRIFEEILRVPYPFEKYAIVSVQDFIFGGMEHVSATTLTDNRFPDKRSEEDFASTYARPDRNHIELLSHELAHQWFGDLVTLRDWAHAWLNEGLATYLEAMYIERKFGADEFRRDLEYKAESAFEEDSKRYRRPIVERVCLYPDDLFDDTTYDKGAWMLHQLRYMLGDETFLEGVREFVKRFAKKNADTDDFRKVMEDVSGLSLESYFHQSYFKGGYPEFEVEYGWNELNDTADLVVKQVQKADEMTPVFSLPVDLVFHTRSGRHVKRVRISLAQEKFSFSLDSRPEIVEFDPQEWLFKKVSFKKGLSLLANQLRSSPDASSRARAADELSSFRSDEAVGLLKEALQKEQFWDVRAKAARSLGKIGTKAALEVLIGSIKTRHRKVRRAVVEALSKFDDDRILSIVGDILLTDESPYVQAEAALSLAKIGKGNLIEKLSEAMELPSPNSTLTEACLEALGYLKDSEVNKIVSEHLKYGKPTRARIGALKGLARRGFLHGDEVASLKDLLLKDKQFSVRDQVLTTVRELADRRFIETLKGASESDIDPRIRRKSLELYFQLSSETESAEAISRLRADVEKLKQENTKLRQSL